VTEKKNGGKKKTANNGVESRSPSTLKKRCAHNSGGYEKEKGTTLGGASNSRGTPRRENAKVTDRHRGSRVGTVTRAGWKVAGGEGSPWLPKTDGKFARKHGLGPNQNRAMRESGGGADGGGEKGGFRAGPRKKTLEELQ